MEYIRDEEEARGEVRDNRPATWFWVNNNIIDTFGEKIGAPGIAIYVCLARYANRNGKCFPSVRTIAKQLNLTVGTVRKYISILNDHKIIARTERMSAAGDRLSTLYTLLPVDDPGGSMVDPPPSPVDTEQDLLNKRNPEPPIVPQGDAGLGIIANIRESYRLDPLPDLPLNYPKKIIGHGEITLVSQGEEVIAASQPGQTTVATETRQQAEGDHSLPLLTSPSHNPTKKSGVRNIERETQEVLTYLNQVSESRFQIPGLIPKILKDGATVDECKLVIDWIADTWSAKVKDQYFNQTTPFRPSNFDKNREAARKWAQKQHRPIPPSPLPAAPAPPAAPTDRLARLQSIVTERSPYAPR